MNVSEKIKEIIRLEGPITFERFMEEALYRQGMGYYTSLQTDIGKSGDYYTSPHLHPAFGAALGRQITEMWRLMGEPQGFEIIEAGGGKGYLAKDMLDYLRDKDVFKTLKYTLLELNPVIAEKQKLLLKNYPDKVRWINSFSGLSIETGCILSNELFDAMPVHIVETDNELKEIYVSLKNGEFIETLGSLSTEEIVDYLDEFNVKLPEGFRTEINLKMKGWLYSACDALKEGFILTIDYGYPARDYHSEDRERGTLLCYHKHDFSENPYVNVGKQDITAHVNFSALKKWGEAKGFKTIGFSRQGPYLVSLGIAEIAAEILKNIANPLEFEMVKNLFMPGTIGDTHKVLIQYRGTRRVDNLTGFNLSNKLNWL